MSLIYVTMADSTRVKHIEHTKKQRALNNIAHEWSERGFREIRPRFNQAQLHYFSAKNMKMG